MEGNNRIIFQSKEIDSFKLNMFLRLTMREGGVHPQSFDFSLAELFREVFTTIKYRANLSLVKGN